MSHGIEKTASGEHAVAWTGKPPWHGLGKELDPRATPREMQKAAHLDWAVKMLSCFTEHAGKRIRLPQKALVRVSDNVPLTVTGRRWNPIQNDDAFDFFTDFGRKGQLEMSCAGCLDVPGEAGGKIVWVLAKARKSFTLFKRDLVETYVLFNNPHSYGRSAGILATPTRVECQNTLAMALRNGKGDMHMRISHRKPFSVEEAKSTMAALNAEVDVYEEKARLLASHRMSKEDAEDYFRAVFPAAPGKGGKKEARGEMTRGAKTIASLLESQPGAELGEGTWWQGLNAVTFAFDHVLGREDKDADNQAELVNRRLANSWFGWAQRRKLAALDIAVERATKAKGTAVAA